MPGDVFCRTFGQKLQKARSAKLKPGKFQRAETPEKIRGKIEHIEDRQHAFYNLFHHGTAGVPEPNGFQRFREQGRRAGGGDVLGKKRGCYMPLTTPGGDAEGGGSFGGDRTTGPAREQARFAKIQGKSFCTHSPLLFRRRGGGEDFPGFFCFAAPAFLGGTEFFLPPKTGRPERFSKFFLDGDLRASFRRKAPPGQRAHAAQPFSTLDEKPPGRVF